MSLSSNPEARARQLANLRPVSRDPALASMAGKLHGFGSGTARTCSATTRDGRPCPHPAAYGSPKCVTHGARRYKGAPPNPHRHLNDARRELSRRGPAPEELQRHPAWKAALGRGKRGYPDLLALSLAWQELQNGNPRPWRKLTAPTT